MAVNDGYSSPYKTGAWRYELPGQYIQGKFGRNYLFTIQGIKGTHRIEPPLTLEFDITRALFSSANVGAFRIYNLSEQNRADIRKDMTDYSVLRNVTLEMGYQQNAAMAFSGNYSHAWSVREGTNWITEIHAFDGGYAFANANMNPKRVFPQGTPRKVMIQALITDLKAYGVTPGAVGNEYLDNILLGNTYDDSITQVLSDLTGKGFFIDNTRANALGMGEVIASTILIINPDSGLLGTPLREQHFVDFTMLLEPGLALGHQVQLTSFSDKTFNGYYKVVAVKHRGVISEAVCGEAITSVRLMASNPLDRPFLQVGSK